eukprot:Gb_10246 [translate_table: standard]
MPLIKEKKLLPGEEVEVRQHEEGLRGSWHAGIVIKAKKLHRSVEYKELLSEDRNSKLIETIRVRKIVEGWASGLGSNKKYRGCIRPLPPALVASDQKWTYGLCVDALYEDAWWEGVLLDSLEESEERAVFFPDEGDEHKIHIKNLRVTQDWDETEGIWSVRGHWVLADMRDTFERKGISIKEVWYHIRLKDDFLRRVGEWTIGEQCLWLKFVKEVSSERVSQSVRPLLAGINSYEKESKLTHNYEKAKDGSQAYYSRLCLDSIGSQNSAGAQDYKRAVVFCGAQGSNEAQDTILPIDTSGKARCKKSWNFSAGGPDLKGQMNCIERESFDDPVSRADLGSQADCIDGELSEAPASGADLMNLTECSRSIKESWEGLAGGIDRKGQSDLVDRELYKAPVNRVELKDQTDCIGRVFPKDPPSRADWKDQTECIHRVLSEAPVSAAVDSKDGSDCIDRVLCKSSANDGVLSDTPASGTVLEDLMDSVNDSNSSQALPGKCGSLALAAHRKSPQHRSLMRRSPPSWKPPAKGLTLNSEYCPLAALNYSPTLEKNEKKQARLKAKMHLLAVGWRFEFKPRNGKYDTRYVSPTGQNYYSLLQACVAWKNEQMVHGLIDRSYEHDVKAKQSRKRIFENDLDGVSASRPLKKMAVKGTRNLPLSSGRSPKRSGRLRSSLEVAKCEFNNSKFAERSLKNSKGLKQQVSRNQRVNEHGSKKRNVACKVVSVPEAVPRAKACGFQSECFSQEIIKRNVSTEGRKAKKSRQGPSVISGFSSRKLKLNSEELLESQKQKKGKTCRLLTKRKGKSVSGYRMQVLLSSPGKAKDLSSGPGKRTVRSVLSWMIENGMVAQNQKVFYWNRKDNCPQAEGWITCEGIMCICCKKVYSLTNFEAHAGSKLHRPSANLILEDGRSLLQCQMQVLDNNNRSKGRRTTSRERRKRKSPLFESDDICSICHVGGTLILCDHCPSSFHLECINMELVPEGNWYCPSCRCVLCGRSEFNGDGECFTEMTVLFCDQCECQYHVGCLYEKGMPKIDSCPEGNWFCSKKCSEIFAQLRNLVGRVNLVGADGLSWTLLRSREEDSEINDPSNVEVMAEHHSKLSVALTVMHECFVPIIEPRTKKDLIAEVIFNRGSDLNRLNFRGFYTMILERGDELISVATARIHGERVAEMPLIGTRVEYRRKGMCRLLVNELEKLLRSLGVEKLVLPAVSELKQTWQSAFGFQEMTPSERLKLLELSFVGFPDTTVLQKLLSEASLEQGAVPGETISANGVELLHLSLAGRHEGHEIEKGTDSENIEINACKIGSSYSEVAETVTPIRSLPYNIRTCPLWHSNAGEECLNDGTMEGTLLKVRRAGFSSAVKKNTKNQENATEAECHTVTPVEDELDDDSMVVVGTTRSNRLVRQVRWKVAYSYQRKELNPCLSDEPQSNDREIKPRKRRRVEDNILRVKNEGDAVIDDSCPVSSCHDSLISSQNKGVQFDSYVIRGPDEQFSAIGMTDSSAALNNCSPHFDRSLPVMGRPKFLESGPGYKIPCKVEYEGNVVGNSNCPNSDEQYRGYMGCLESFKYFYKRRRKQICAGNGLPGEIPSEGSLPGRSSILHSHTVC